MTIIRETDINTIIQAHRVVAINGITLSLVNPVFEVMLEDKKRILKIVPKHNVSSLIQPTMATLQSHQALGEATRSSRSTITIPPILSITEWPDCFSLLMPYLPLIPDDFTTDFATLVNATQTFHRVATPLSDNIANLPWHSFSPEFSNALKQRDNWNKVSTFLETYQPADKHTPVMCHNDLHPGNVYRYKSNVCLLDMGEVAIASPLNDLGILLANYIVHDNMSSQSITLAIKKLLEVYNIEPTDTSIQDCLLYAIRKLYIIEAYFCYISINYGKDTKTTIASLHKRQIATRRSLEVIYA